MSQNSYYIHIRLAMCALVALPVLLFTPLNHAADEDIDIPYTDNYGYVYDANTGTFIKPDQPTADTTAAGQDATISTASISTPPDHSSMAPPATDVDTNSAVPANKSSALTYVLLVLLIIAGVVRYQLYARNKRKRVEDRD